MISRCTSFTPPPNVPTGACRYAASSSPRSTAPGVSRLRYPALPSTSRSKRHASTRSSVPNTFIADASAGFSAPVARLVATRQLASFSTSIGIVLLRSGRSAIFKVGMVASACGESGVSWMRLKLA